MEIENAEIQIINKLPELGGEKTTDEHTHTHTHTHEQQRLPRVIAISTITT